MLKIHRNGLAHLEKKNGVLGWSRILSFTALLLLCASFATAQGVITSVYPGKVAQGYPLNASTFGVTIYFDAAFGGVPENATWVNAPGGPQDLPFSSTPSTFFATLIAPSSMTATLGDKQIQICRGEGSVCTVVAGSAKLQVVPAQVLEIDPARVTQGVAAQDVYLRYTLPRSNNPSKPPAVFIVNSDGVETPVAIAFYSTPEGEISDRFVQVTVPASYFASPATFKFRVVEEYDDDANTPLTTDVSAAQAIMEVVPPARFITASPLPPAQLGPPAQPYSTEIVATGGTPFPSEGGPDEAYYMYYTDGDNPPPAGLFLSGSFSKTATLTGTPTAPAGKYSFPVYVEDYFGVVSSKVYRIGLQTPAPALTITTPSLQTGKLGLAYSGRVMAAGGVPGYEFSIAEGGRGLPAGLTLAPDGNVTGVPTTSGAFLVDVLAEDAQLRQVVRAVQINILPQFPPLVYTTSSMLPVGEVGTPYQAKLETSGGAVPVQFVVGVGLLPAGLVINESTGVISGTPTTVSQTTFLATARDAQGVETSGLFTIRVVDERLPLLITTASPLPPGGVGESYTATISATGGLPPYGFSVSAGALPPGLSLNPQTGVIGGNPTQEGSYTFTVRVSDTGGDTAVTREFVIQVLSGVRLVTQNPLPDGLVGAPYNLTFAAQSGVPPYVFSVIEGQLPSGITLNPATGEISGTPTAPFSGSFTLRVRDSATPAAVDSRTYQIRILQPLELTVLELPVGSVNVPYQVQFGAQGGVAPYSFSLLSGSLPAGITLSSSGQLSGTATAPATATLVVQVADTRGITAQRSYSLNIQALPVSGGSLSLSTAVGVSNSQNDVSVTISSPQSEVITGTVTLTLSGSGTPPIDDPAVQFIGGGRTASFTIAAGQTSATFGSSPSARFQTGTTAATLIFTATFQRAGQDATPSPAPRATLTIPVTPPTLTDLNVTRNASALTVVVRGFAPERNITTAVLEFTRRPGAPGANPERFDVNVAQAFQQWFGSAASQPFGSQFRLTIPVTLTGDPADITGVTVRLTGPSGTGNSLSATF
ncbi:MAG: putative Ig domain-containing protein [Bryobacterales bacterium]|nr:putative Ig domain-containing protein [Bryobacterales bacterium]